MKVCRRCNSRFDDSQLVCPDDGEFLEDDPAALIGTLLDRTYRIEKLLGKGGMGAVYLGRHTHLRDRVAIKVLPKKLSLNARFLERFFREGQAARAIRHPNVVAAYDLRTTDDGITYLVFEYVEGISLREAIKQWGIFSPAAALAVLEPVADALGEAHRMGIIHRDLKPDNIMVSGDRHQPVVKLLDLGIAKLRDLVGSTMARPVDLTVAGQILGTPYYMSPEQWGALSRDGNPAIDGRADVYSLGVVLYELVSGRWPFHGATLAEFRAQHLTAEPPPIGSHIAIPATFETALRVALAKDRDDRYPTPQALIDALKQSLIGVSSLRDDGGARMAPEQQRDPRVFAQSQVETGTGSVPYHLTGKPVDTDLSQAVDTAVSGTRAEALLGAPHSSRFQVRRRLGAGGFGVVYEAFDSERQSDVAVKVLYQADAKALYQFKKEFRTLSQLSHPNLVSLYELISDGSQWLFTMERIDGVNFCEHVRGGSRAPDDATESLGSSPAVTEKFAQETVQVIDDSDASGSAVTYVGLRTGSSPSQIERLRDALRQLTGGLMHLHRSSLLHRDVKPSNVLVDTTGRVVLLDFGIVGELSPDGLLRAADVFGTPVYMSPEQARGGDVTEASDWYSVGVILYEALCGAPPFAGSLQEVLLQKQMSAPPAPSFVVSDVPEDLDRLCVDLLNLDPSQRPTANSILERLGAASGDAARKPRSAGAEVVGIVGRDDCLQKLRDSLDEVRAGTPVVALVHGGSGMGKTTLVRSFLEDLRRDDPDIVLLEGHCYEQEAVPYKALDSVVDALSQYLQGFTPQDVALYIPQDFDALTRLFPVLRRVDAWEDPKRPRPLIRDSQELRNRASRALRDLVGRLGSRRLVVMAIDDLQWGDMDSKAILDDIFRPPRQPPLLFVASYRSEEVATNRALREFVSGCRSTDGVRVMDVEVGNLSREASEQLALEILDSDTASRERAVEIAAEAQGNPYFVIELARFAQQGDRPTLLKVDDPDSGDRVTRAQVDSMIRLRVEALPAPVRRLLETTAVAGQPVPLKVATRAAEIERDESAILARLRSEHLIRVREAGQQKEIESYHDRIRETVVAGIDESRLKAYHLGLAEAWEQFGEADAETLARHYYEAGMPQQALGFVIAAANKAAQALAFERAAGFYARALEFDGAGNVDWQDIRVRLAQSLANAGMGAEAAKAFLEAAAGAQPSERLDLERLAAEKYISSGYIDEGLAVLHSVLARIGIGNPGNPLSTLVRLIFYSLLVSLRGYRFVEKPAERLSSSELLRVDTCWSVVLGFSMVDPVRHVYFQKRHVLFALGAGDPRRAARALAFEGALLTAGKGRARLHAREIMEQSKELAERAGDPHALGLATLWAGGAAWLRGDWKICADLTRQAELIFRQQCVGVASERVTSEVFMLAALVWMGELHAHEELFPQLLQEARGRGDRYAEATLILLTYRHVLLLAADEPERAEQELEYAMSRWSQEGFHLQHFWAVFGRIEIALYEDRPDRAWRLATEMWPALAKSFLLRLQTVHIFARHLRARCALALLANEDAGDRTPDVPSRRSPIRSIERDIRAIERESADWGRGLAGLLRAGLFSAVGRPSAATDALRLAAQTLDASNMHLFASAARYRLGQMNDDGKSLDIGENARIRLQDCGVTRVDAMVNVLAPGSWRRTEADGGHARGTPAL